MQTRTLSTLVAVAIAAISMATACNNNETPAEFTNLAQPPPSVEGLYASQILELLMTTTDGESACDPSQPAVGEDVHSDYFGKHVPIPQDLILDEGTIAQLFREIGRDDELAADYKFHWIEEWRIVLFAPPPGNLGGSARYPTVYDIILIDINEDVGSDDSSDSDYQPKLRWGESDVTTLVDCVPRR